MDVIDTFDTKIDHLTLRIRRLLITDPDSDQLGSQWQDMEKELARDLTGYAQYFIYNNGKYKRINFRGHENILWPSFQGWGDLGEAIEIILIHCPDPLTLTKEDYLYCHLCGVPKLTTPECEEDDDWAKCDALPTS